MSEFVCARISAWIPMYRSMIHCVFVNLQSGMEWSFIAVRRSPLELLSFDLLPPRGVHHFGMLLQSSPMSPSPEREVGRFLSFSVKVEELKESTFLWTKAPADIQENKMLPSWLQLLTFTPKKHHKLLMYVRARVRVLACERERDRETLVLRRVDTGSWTRRGPFISTSLGSLFCMLKSSERGSIVMAVM